MPSEVVDLAEARHSPHVAKKRRQRIREILRAALAIAGEEGREALTLNRLAKRLGLTTAALYRYFPSKDALTAELQRAVIHALARATHERVTLAEGLADRHALPETDRSLLGVIVSALAFERFSQTSPVEFGILSMNLSSPDYALPDREAAHVFEAAWSALSDLATRFERSAACGALDPGDSSERAVALWAGLQGVAQTRKLSRSAANRIDTSSIAQGLVSALLIGWGADPGRLRDLIDLTAAERLGESSRTVRDAFEESDPDQSGGATRPR